MTNLFSCAIITIEREENIMKLIDKRSKKIKKEEAKKMRITNGFNTGTRTHKSKKDYDRKAIKKELREYL